LLFQNLEVKENLSANILSVWFEIRKTNTEFLKLHILITFEFEKKLQSSHFICMLGDGGSQS